jgi:hypothetical protein
MIAHTAVGLFLATGIPPATTLDWGTAVLGILLWVICLNGGTLALYSALYVDDGDI